MALHIGLTGGIGSGKSTVAKVFESLGIPVYYADNAAKELMNSDESLKKAIKDRFGVRAYVDDKLDQQYIASIVFNDAEKLEALNSIVHPATINDAIKWSNLQTTAYTIKEAALLFESGADKMLDYVIGVTAPESLRIERVMKRDGVSREEVLKRLKRQMDEEKKISLCDFILVNDETQLLIPQVLGLHKKLEGLAESSK